MLVALSNELTLRLRTLHRYLSVLSNASSILRALDAVLSFKVDLIKDFQLELLDSDELELFDLMNTSNTCMCDWACLFMQKVGYSFLNKISLILFIFIEIALLLYNNIVVVSLTLIFPHSITDAGVVRRLSFEANYDVKCSTVAAEGTLKTIMSVAESSFNQLQPICQAGKRTQINELCRSYISIIYDCVALLCKESSFNSYPKSSLLRK